MLSFQKKGILFEDNIHNLLLQTKKSVYRERDIIQSFGKHITAIDHMIILDDYCLCIQDKYQQTTVSISQTNHFIKCVRDMSDILKKPCIGLYISRVGLSAPSNESFKSENQKLYNNNKFITLSATIQEEIIKKLTKYLYKKNIFLYDADDDLIMIDRD